MITITTNIRTAADHTKTKNIYVLFICQTSSDRNLCLVTVFIRRIIRQNLLFLYSLVIAALLSNGSSVFLSFWPWLILISYSCNKLSHLVFICLLKFLLRQLFPVFSSPFRPFFVLNFKITHNALYFYFTTLDYLHIFISHIYKK